MQLFWDVGDQQLLLYTYNRTDVPREFVDGGNAAPPRPPPPPAVAEFSVAGRRLVAGPAPPNPKLTLQCPGSARPPDGSRQDWAVDVWSRSLYRWGVAWSVPCCGSPLLSRCCAPHVHAGLEALQMPLLHPTPLS